MVTSSANAVCHTRRGFSTQVVTQILRMVLTIVDRLEICPWQHFFNTWILHQAVLNNRTITTVFKLQLKRFQSSCYDSLFHIIGWSRFPSGGANPIICHFFTTPPPKLVHRRCVPVVPLDRHCTWYMLSSRVKLEKIVKKLWIWYFNRIIFGLQTWDGHLLLDPHLKQKLINYN